MTAVRSSGIVAVLGQPPILASHGIPRDDGRGDVSPVTLVSGNRDRVIVGRPCLRRRRRRRGRRDRRGWWRQRRVRGPAYGHRRVVPVSAQLKPATCFLFFFFQNMVCVVRETGFFFYKNRVLKPIRLRRNKIKKLQKLQKNTQKPNDPRSGGTRSRHHGRKATILSSSTAAARPARARHP